MTSYDEIEVGVPPRARAAAAAWLAAQLAPYTRGEYGPADVASRLAALAAVEEGVATPAETVYALVMAVADLSFCRSRAERGAWERAAARALAATWTLSLLALAVAWAEGSAALVVLLVASSMVAGAGVVHAAVRMCAVGGFKAHLRAAIVELCEVARRGDHVQ